MRKQGLVGLIVLVLALSGTVHGAGTATQPTGAAPADLNSPRATMTTFLNGMHAVLAREPGAWKPVLSCFNFSKLAAGNDSDTPQSLAQKLYEAINRIETVDVSRLPGPGDVRAMSIDAYTYFPQFDNPQHASVLKELKGHTPGQIVLRRQADGRWLFSASTVAQIPALYEAMAGLPAVYDTSGAQVVAMLGPTFAKTPWWGWAYLFICILAGLAVGKAVQAGLKAVGNSLKNKGIHLHGTVAHNAASPLSLLFLTIGLQVGLSGVVMDPQLGEFTSRGLKFLYIVIAGWFAYNLADVIDLVLRNLTARTASQFDDMMVPLIRKALRIFLVIILTLVVAQNVFGLDITAWLAGLSILGLAVSFAAQESIKNLFGSVTVFFDRPFSVGDFVHFDGLDATVEEIGFRSTRMRTLDGHLVTVPNLKFLDNSVRNITARPTIRRVLDVTVTYDTSPAKMDQAVQILKDLLAQPDIAAPFDVAGLPPRAYFNDYNAASLNIRVFYWYTLDDGRDYWSYMAHAELFNRKLFEAYGQAGIEFAFPTQTLYLAGDSKRPLTIGQPG